MQNFFRKLGKLNVYPFLNALPKDTIINKELLHVIKSKNYNEYKDKTTENWFSNKISIVASLLSKKYPIFNENINKQIVCDKLILGNFSFIDIPKTIKVLEELQFNSSAIYFDELITPKITTSFYSCEFKDDLKIKSKIIKIEKCYCGNLILNCDLAIINNSFKIDLKSKIKNIILTLNDFYNIDIPTNFIFQGNVKLSKNSNKLLENVVINGNFDISETSLIIKPDTKIIVHGDIIMNKRQKKIYNLNNAHNLKI